MARTTERVALVTGANKGIGLEIARRLGRAGFKIALGARDAARGAVAAKQLASEGVDARVIELEVTDPAQVKRLAGSIEKEFGRLDVLVNNAGVYIDTGHEASTVDVDRLRSTFETNFFGAWLVTQAVLPLLRRSSAARIVNLSSTLGSIGTLANSRSNTAPAYQASKAALNAFTVLLANELAATKIKVNAACPGWVRTDMGTQAAPRSVEEGADTPVWLATLPDDGPTGGFFNSRQPVAW